MAASSPPTPGSAPSPPVPSNRWRCRSRLAWSYAPCWGCATARTGCSNWRPQPSMTPTRSTRHARLCTATTASTSAGTGH
ncbi:hypothetical protein ACFPRL_06695 [Pseudoclavibacter helvolus]